MGYLRGLLMLALLWGYRLARAAIAGLGVSQPLGAPAAILVVLVCAALGLHWVLRALAALTLWRLWHWPWWAAVLAAAPRLVLVLPGLITTGLARVRHPRARWPAPGQSMPQPRNTGP